MFSIRLTLSVILAVSVVLQAADISSLPGTQPLTMEGDLASQMVDGIDQFLLNELAKSPARRDAVWKSYDAQNTLEARRKRLAKMLDIRENERVPFDAPELVATTETPALVGQGDGFEVYAIRWPVLYDPQPDRRIVLMHGEGLLLKPIGREPSGDVVVIPHCDQTPEQLAGLMPGVPYDLQFARHHAEGGCRVIVPTLIDRENYLDGLTRREYVHRAAFELGRHVIGYEVQKVLAAVDWFAKSDHKIGVIGHGDGGMMALLAGALDERIKAVHVNGYFGPRERMWEEPLDRNVFGRLNEFGDAELYKLMDGRRVFIHYENQPTHEWKGKLGAPARLREFTPIPELRDEMIRADPALSDRCKLFTQGPWRLHSLIFEKPKFSAYEPFVYTNAEPCHLRKAFDPNIRQLNQFNEMDRYNQAMLLESENVRAAFVKPLIDAANKGGEVFEKVAAEFRRKFYDETIGRFDSPLKPMNARTRKTGESEKWTRYDVVLDVFDDVFAYGVLTIPKGIRDGEKRAVVVCQHGLEGRPTDVLEGDSKFYHDFGTKLAERGYITFAPQNPYIFKDRFRTLQRKANPLGKSLFSIIIPQHQQIVNWLKMQPNVDGSRIAFYGLSYGGKSAMRIPAVVTDYALSICSGDFNEWVWKNASTATFAKRYTFANKGEYEMFEWDLGSTFNYAEMAMLIAPRPFMVERGHFDGVAPDEAVAYEYAKVRRFYAMNLKQPERTRIEWFNGPHTVNCVGTFEFLDQWLLKK